MASSTIIEPGVIEITESDVDLKEDLEEKCGRFDRDMSQQKGFNCCSNGTPYESEHPDCESCGGGAGVLVVQDISVN